MLTLPMTAGVAPEIPFTLWIDRSPERSRGRRRVWRDGGIRFAFYGRISTDGYQDPVSSRRWQLDAAVQLTERRGCIAVEFFDIGYSRCLPWHERPGAAQLLAEAARADRRFDAVVVGGTSVRSPAGRPCRSSLT
ncbi:hypothetical protein [Actinoplanes sp. NPDC049316]|uniref:hypothetical protein n=1 Tax=Actinoplanes sp. NPDC049316 TaxID=3154727 RepID=UPI003416FF65